MCYKPADMLLLLLLLLTITMSNAHLVRDQQSSSFRRLYLLVRNTYEALDAITNSADLL